MARLDLTDSMQTAIVKMAEGNPGAVSALIDLYKKGPWIDPQSAMPEFMPMLSLDQHGIYGSSIYILWSDKCDRDARKVLVLLRAVQLGHWSKHKLQELAADQGREVNLSAEEFNALDTKVRADLSGFKRA